MDEPLQVGTRVSVAAGEFDSKYGISWSRATFGEGGESTRIYGTVKELLTEGRGKQTYYRVKWDGGLEHDPKRGPNASLIGRQGFTHNQLKREDPRRGRRLTADESNPRNRPTLPWAVEA